MDLQRLRTFRTVATLMNFNRAASVLNYSQSAVSTQIKTLENEIGVLLFKRIGRWPRRELPVWPWRNIWRPGF
jgi:DNA-binding transcriptional LysR family regulator